MHPLECGIQLRATGTPTRPIYVYEDGDQDHLLVVGPGAKREHVVDVTGHVGDPWWVVQVLAYGFFDLAYRETIRYQRQHVWKLARPRSPG